MRIKFTGKVYGVFGSPLNIEESVIVDFLNQKIGRIEIWYDDKAIIVNDDIIFQRDTVKIELMEEGN
jgi:hypothetical protein